MKRTKYSLLALLALMLTASPVLTACSDEPDSENYYTFTGEMMSDFLKSRPEYSEFTTIVERAGLMDLLSSYGHFTCFAPNNDAINNYLQKKGKTSIDQLSDADCDTIARTHLMDNMYATIAMADGTLNTANMNGRYIQVTHGMDNDSNAVVFLNKMSHIYFDLKDDSVENGIMQPVDVVLESSTGTIADVLADNPKISLFVEALKATGLQDSIVPMKDESYDPSIYSKYRYVSDFWHEVATVPDTKKYGFTIFAVPDSVLQARYNITDLQGLYNKACEIYDAVYPADAGASGHSFDNLTDSVNPLRRFMAYHILTRDVIGWNKLTPLVLDGQGGTPRNPFGGGIGIKTTIYNPEDFYETMLPHTMMRVEQLTVTKWVGAGIRGQRYINRRYDDEYTLEGTLIHPDVTDYEQDAENGRYFYIDDIIAFDTNTRDIVLNQRIRMDFSTVWPEVMTENIRLNGDPNIDDNSGVADDTYQHGRNYYFPQGYLKGVTIKGNAALVYRRPHWNFWSYEGDEWNLFGDYDFAFKLPPVPYEGEWQVRLGFCALPSRGVAQIYFDDKPQGIPLDMRVNLNDASVLGEDFITSINEYTSMTDEEKAAYQKAVKNKGRYVGPYGGYHTDGSAVNEFVTNPRTHRVVLCQVHVDPNQDHYLRIRCTSTSKLGNNNEFMIDYLELVPKSVYGVTDEGQMENDL